ncbi:MAG: type II toxin-antitoxin system Phd/YefM family antitoxin [Verrucomicrobiota bacterium]|nr:type II toxin-antitoxin system Phd/YefM family antitoxin [Verrucomicrobiota bacterium]
MKLYTYSDARQQFASVLDTASREGKVLIRKRDGSLFALIPEPKAKSPLDVVGVATDVETSEMIATLRAERGRARARTLRR